MARSLASRIRIGIGGWSYEPWRGPFYPDGLVQRRELEYASRHLTSIEINSTFYGAQRAESFARWHDETPDGFVFAVKAPRFATHRKALAEAGASIARFVEGGVTRLGEKLGPINWQFDPGKRFDPDDYARFLDLLPAEADGLRLRHALEVRHESFRTSEFVALARANPDKYNCATPPIGTSSQMQLEFLKLTENLPKLADVVFKGGGDAITALLGGNVQLSSGSLAPALPHIKAGTLRCLAVSAENRWPDLPDVPTMQEAGYKDFVFPTDMVLLAPAKTPPDMIKWVEAETLKVLSSPEMKQKMYKAGFLVKPKGADVAWARVTHEIGLFKGIIEQAGIKKL